MNRFVVVVVAAFALVVVVGGTAGCKRPCQKAENCKRSCECVNGQNNTRLDCAMEFRCEGDTQVCEDDFDALSCDDICVQYAARGECGLERCISNDECEKVLSCPGVNPDGTPNPAIQQECRVPFECNQDEKVCEPASTTPDATLCATTCAAAQQAG